jgi:predicted N-acyltransferase
MSSEQLRILDSLGEVDPAAWDALAGDNPFLQHAFLHALHETGCATEETGWKPRYLSLWDAGALVGAMPLYLKSHSWGEYVFDWSWAEAYHRHGRRYYPKLLCAVPFTPACGPRLLAHTVERRARLADAALALARDLRASSLHVLLPTASQAAELESRGLMLRSSVQFHWENRDYADFDAFLAGMNHDKRKKIKQERRRVREAGLSFQRLTGREATTSQWDFFTACYKRTYREHSSSAYLNRAFFARLAAIMPANLMLVIASRGSKPVAAALNVHSAHTLYGRYWGATEFHPGLHFETCYYQAIEWCIEQGIRVFEGGAQGEHKLARGLLPRRVLSAHWLAQAEFAQAVGIFLAREAHGVAGYLDELSEHSPYKEDGPRAEE